MPEEDLVGHEEGEGRRGAGGVLLAGDEAAAGIDGRLDGRPRVGHEGPPGMLGRQVREDAGRGHVVHELQEGVELLVGREAAVVRPAEGVVAALPGTVRPLAAQEEPAQMVGHDAGVLVMTAA